MGTKIRSRYRVVFTGPKTETYGYNIIKTSDVPKKHRKLIIIIIICPKHVYIIIFYYVSERVAVEAKRKVKGKK